MDKKDLKNVNVGLQLLAEAIGLPVLVANLLCLKEEPLASAGRGKGMALSSLDFSQWTCQPFWILEDCTGF